MLNIVYEIKDRETKVWHEFNGEYFEPKLNKDTYYISGFSANIRVKDNYLGKYYPHYSICYTLRPCQSYWTPITCNGERLEVKKSITVIDYFTDLIIYVVESPAQVPPINGVTYFEYFDYVNK